MTGRSIKVVIDALGNAKVEADGFHGTGCTEATAPIERALTGEVGTDRTIKSEFYEVSNEETSHDHLTN